MWDRQRLLLVILFISLAINVFLVGLVVAKRTELHAVPGHHLMAGFGWLNTDVAHSPEVVALWNGRGGDVHSAMHELRVAQQRVRETLQADPWDADSSVMALAELRQRVGVAQERWHQVLLERAAKLPVAQRAKLAVLVPGTGRGMGRGMGRNGGEKCR
ncbi:MAG: periplasmic heavy metal sensor [Magnetococcus sp. YQC-3]